LQECKSLAFVRIIFSCSHAQHGNEIKRIDSSSADCPLATDKLSCQPPQNDTKTGLAIQNDKVVILREQSDRRISGSKPPLVIRSDLECHKKTGRTCGKKILPRPGFPCRLITGDVGLLRMTVDNHGSHTLSLALMPFLRKGV
jgi:hypothetical protein